MDRRSILRKASEVVRKKATSEGVEQASGIDKNTQRIIKDMVELGNQGDEKISRREVLGKVGKKLLERQPGKIGEAYNKVMKDTKFSYMTGIDITWF